MENYISEAFKIKISWELHTPIPSSSFAFLHSIIYLFGEYLMIKACYESEFCFRL